MKTMTKTLCRLLSAALIAYSSALSSSSNGTPKFAEIAPLRAAMLTKQWQGFILDVDQKVGVVPELKPVGSTAPSAAVPERWPELERRSKCAKQFGTFYESTFALALADKNPPKIAHAKRLLANGLMVDGAPRGPNAKVFASLTMPATMSLVECLDGKEWSVLALTVNPTERNMDSIATAELAMLEELRSKATKAGASLRILKRVKDTLAGDAQMLCLKEIVGDDDDDDSEEIWFSCDE
mmetsp:Transcript_26455/g.38667  ORF Transcript_26455/g.38667 Transcript_26455/m.38667 type:complete len:239 (-) Transcript_26455:140-856(-)